MARVLTRKEYCDVCGPTVGDKIYLADTGLVIEIERDLTKEISGYGTEANSGGGKSFRDGMVLTPGMTSAEGVLDVAYTNAVILDPVLGVIKGDIGVKDGRIVGIGKCGNPYTQKITPGLVVGVATELVPLEGAIITTGGVECHIHFLGPDQVWEAMANGVTTMLGGGNGSQSQTIDAPGPWHLKEMIESHEALPVNAGFLGRGNSSLPAAIEEQALAGAIGMKIHEDFGATPQVIRTCLDVADKYDFQIAIHTDGLNESGYVQKTIDAFEGRTIHAYHVEGAGGGHAPDVMTVTGVPNVLPSSTNATKPYTVNSVAELLWMTIANHNLNPKVPEDMMFAESRIRNETIAAEDVLHDMGAISMMSADSQGMGRVGETILRTWQLASKMKQQRGALPEDKPGNDNERVLRYLAKYTINPAKTMGIDEYVGSLQVGRLGDIVVWDPRYFGIKARMVYKSGAITYSHTGDVNASTEWTQPMWYRVQYGGIGNNINRYNKIFVTKAAIENGLGDQLPFSKDKLLPVKNCRNLSKKDMVRNSFLPNIKIDPETYQVFIDGERITCEPAKKLPSAQLYFFR